MANVAEAQTKEPQIDGQSRLPKTAGKTSRLSFSETPWVRWLLLGAVLILLVVVLGVWRYVAGRETTDDAQIDGHIVPISAKLGGTVLEVKIEENQVVKAGAVLVKIDPRDYQVALATAQADLANSQAAALAARTGVPITSTTTASQLSTSQAKVQSGRAGVMAAQKEVDAARARQRAAQAHRDELQAKEIKAARDLDRMKQLIAKGEISQEQYDATVSEADAARAAEATAQADVAAAEQAVSVAQSGVEQARAMLAQSEAEVRAALTAPQRVAVSRAQAQSADARVQQAQAALDQAQLNLEYTTVIAPQSGVISKKAVERGQIVQPGQPLFAIVPLEGLWVTANFKETQLGKMRIGQRALIAVDAYGGRKYRAYVHSMSAATGEKFSLLPPENATGNYVKVIQRVPVRIEFERGQDPEHLLRPGMSVEPTVFTR
jgi:membrane fusion protein, multidrug efflux system